MSVLRRFGQTFLNRQHELCRQEQTHGRNTSELGQNFSGRNKILGTFTIFALATVLYFLCTDNKPIPLNDEEIASINKFFNAHWDTNYNSKQEFSYSLLSRRCQKMYVHTVIVVHSKPAAFKERQDIRNTLVQMNTANGLPLVVVFLLGRMTNAPLQSSIILESRENGDIVQGNFIDDHSHTTYKHVMTMDWILNFCHRAQVVVKINHDVIVNPFLLYNFTETAEFPNHDIHCYVLETESPDRQPDDKYYTPYNKYPFRLWPEYCAGFAYITTVHAYWKLFKMSSHVRYVSKDDVYVTGLLTIGVRVTKLDIHNLIHICNGQQFKTNEYIFILHEDNKYRCDVADIFKDFKENSYEINVLTHLQDH